LTLFFHCRARRAVWGVIAVLLVAAASAPPAGALTAGDARTQSFKLQSDGMRCYNEGKYKEAIALLQQVVNIHLNSAMAWYFLGLSLAAERRYPEAVEPIKIALDLQPDYVQAHLALGDTYLKLGELDEARAAYLRALEMQPNYAAAHDGIGRLNESLGHDDEAETAYRKALEINVAFADAYTHLGELYLRKGRLDDATNLFLKAITVKPDFSQAYTRLGVALSRQERYEDALAAARKSLELAPQDPEPLVALARIDLEMQSLRRAHEAVAAALLIDPEFVYAHLMLGELARAEGDPERALALLEDRLKRPIDDPRLKRVLTDSIKRNRGEVHRLAALEAAVDADAYDPEALAALARFHAGLRAHLMAAELLRAASDLAGTLEMDAGCHEASSIWCEQSEALRYESGFEYITARRWPEAIELFATLSEAPSRPALAHDALFNLGVARAGAGLDQAAADTFNACLQARPEDLQAQLYLGNALARLGRDDEARRAYGAYLEKCGPTPEAERVRRLVESMIGAAAPPPATPPAATQPAATQPPPTGAPPAASATPPSGSPPAPGAP
jgi:tetratricopeptide (TPR) repeat protein